MLLTEFDMQKFIKTEKDDSYEDGLKKGLRKGELNVLISLVKDNIIPASEACKRSGLSEDEFAKLMKQSENQ